MYAVGLGEKKKKLTMLKNSSASDFTNAMEKAFPKLKDCGGYELLRTPPDSMVTLEVIPIPPGGFTSAHLADGSFQQQAVCYIRPIQNDLETTTSSTEVDDPKYDQCLDCEERIALLLLRDHVNSHDEECYVPPKTMNKVQRPVCLCLKLHDILPLLKKLEETGEMVLGCVHRLCSAVEVQNFYVPNFSESAHHKKRKR